MMDRFESVGVIVLERLAMKGDREKCLEAGMNDYLTKPLRVADLEESLKRWRLLSNATTPNREAPEGRT